jgi:hypothetical protein
MTLEEAIHLVETRQVGRIAAPGQWRVFRDENDEVQVEVFEK